MNRKMQKVYRTDLMVCVVILLIFAIITMFYTPVVAAAEVAAAGGLFLLGLQRLRQAQQLRR